MQADTAQSLVQNEIYGNGNTVMTATNLAIEFRPHYEVEGFTGSKYVFWYDYAVIKWSHLFVSKETFGLTLKI